MSFPLVMDSQVAKRNPPSGKECKKAPEILDTTERRNEVRLPPPPGSQLAVTSVVDEVTEHRAEEAILPWDQ